MTKSLTILARIFQYYWQIFFNGKLWLNRWIFKTLTSNQATYFQVFNLVSSLVNDRWWLDEWCLLVLLWCVLRSCHVVDCTKEFILGLFCTPMLVFVTKDSSIPLFFQANLYWVNLNLKSQLHNSNILYFWLRTHQFLSFFKPTFTESISILSLNLTIQIYLVQFLKYCILVSTIKFKHICIDQ